MTLFAGKSVGRLIAVAGVVLALSAPGLAQSQDQQKNMIGDSRELVQALRAGGYNILVLHGATASNTAATHPSMFDNVSNERSFTESAKPVPRRVANAVRHIGLPVGEVYTSKFNRAYETAVLAGFADIERTADLTEGGLVVTPDENNRRAEAL